MLKTHLFPVAFVYALLTTSVLAQTGDTGQDAAQNKRGVSIPDKKSGVEKSSSPSPTTAKRQKAIDVQRDLALAESAYMKKDYLSALSIFRTLAEAGIGKAQYELSNMLSKGQGAQKDRAESTIWLRRAADNGYAYAIQERQDHTVESIESFIQTLLPLAESGNVDAQLLMGQQFANKSKFKEKNKWLDLALTNSYSGKSFTLWLGYTGSDYIDGATQV